jgi:hypothetical protein
MKKILAILSGLVVLPVLSIAAFLFLAPRPVDTTEVRVFEGDASTIDYCDLPELDGSGANANDIPKAYTPQCGWTEFPMPILANCTEPLAPGATDLRGLWLAYTGVEGHVERIEQCGNRVVVTSTGIIHDFHADGTLENGSRDIEPPHCINTAVTIEFDSEGVLNFSPFGLPFTVVTRRMDGDELVWTYPAVAGDVRMRRICHLPEGNLAEMRN